MDEVEGMKGPEMRWYRLGCERLGWQPLPPAQFWPLYRRYRQCSRRRGWPGWLGLLEWVLLPSVRRIENEWSSLCFIGHALAVGRREGGPDEGAVGAVVPRGPGPREDQAARACPAAADLKTVTERNGLSGAA